MFHFYPEIKEEQGTKKEKLGRVNWESPAGKRKLGEKRDAKGKSRPITKRGDFVKEKGGTTIQNLVEGEGGKKELGKIRKCLDRKSSSS